jgi:hypothetical protein
MQTSLTTIGISMIRKLLRHSSQNSFGPTILKDLILSDLAKLVNGKTNFPLKTYPLNPLNSMHILLSADEVVLHVVSFYVCNTQG